MITVSDICNLVGRGKIASALGVRLSAISNAVVDDRFPAKWYRVVNGLCVDAGIDCPLSLFNFVDPPPTADCSLQTDSAATDFDAAAENPVLPNEDAA